MACLAVREKVCAHARLLKIDCRSLPAIIVVHFCFPLINLAGSWLISDRSCTQGAVYSYREINHLTLYRPRLHDVIHTVTAKLIQESTANQRKLSVRHSVAAKLAAKTFMISTIGRSSFLLKRLGVIVHSVSYKRT